MRKDTAISVTLTPELGEYVRRKIDRGDYDTPDALVREAVARLLSDEGAEFQEIQKAVVEAIEQSEAGLGRSAEEVFRQFRAKHEIPG